VCALAVSRLGHAVRPSLTVTGTGSLRLRLSLPVSTMADSPADAWVAGAGGWSVTGNLNLRILV
jgi:hypothetical protein